MRSPRFLFSDLERWMQDFLSDPLPSQCKAAHGRQLIVRLRDIFESLEQGNTQRKIHDQLAGNWQAFKDRDRHREALEEIASVASLVRLLDRPASDVLAWAQGVAREALGREQNEWTESLMEDRKRWKGGVP